MKELDISFGLRHNLRHMKYVGVHHAAAAYREPPFPLRSVILKSTALHIEKLCRPVPVPWHEPPRIFVKLRPCDDIGKVLCKAGEHLFPASGVELDRLYGFHNLC